MELLAPAGNFDKLVTAVHFGADAVYFAGKMYGLRAFAGNFEDDEIVSAMKYLHEKGKGKKLKSGSSEKPIFEKYAQRNG